MKQRKDTLLSKATDPRNAFLQSAGSQTLMCNRINYRACETIICYIGLGWNSKICVSIKSQVMF
jgi:hypothetical protein